MEKEKSTPRIPVAMASRLKELLDRLWEENNPAAVHLGAVMDEYDSEIKAAASAARKYETDFAGRLASIEKKYTDRIAALESELAAAGESRDKSAQKTAELAGALRSRESEIADLKAKAEEAQTEMNSRYAAKMQELYAKVNRKELEMITRWEEEKKRLSGLDGDYEARVRQLELKEKAMEDDFNFKKAELIKTFEGIRLDFEAREARLAAVERKPHKEGSADEQGGRP